ncbi:AAA family ATPase [Agarilytica rhodophyticola]|uniref:AAA family ATPase n=1 Tax=Agarilytica rhodophyticola TaxID=1737490 RepID=UPI000B344078|nr:AAA family ATPase [Agarilytica rhodophyticola]
MRKVVIFGNSGSGKSTLAKALCQDEELSHLDLDTVAWLPSDPPQRKPISDAKLEVDDFINASDTWVVEGCYSDLLALVLTQASEIIFMNLSVEDCIANAKKRPWEPHKYVSKAEQDANLEMLIDWISQYPTREDVFSRSSHEALFNSYHGKKTMYTSNKNM